MSSNYEGNDTRPLLQPNKKCYIALPHTQLTLHIKTQDSICLYYQHNFGCLEKCYKNVMFIHSFTCTESSMMLHINTNTINKCRTSTTQYNTINIHINSPQSCLIMCTVLMCSLVQINNVQMLYKGKQRLS